jgi:hypothetical protein
LSNCLASFCVLTVKVREFGAYPFRNYSRGVRRVNSNLRRHATTAEFTFNNSRNRRLFAIKIHRASDQVRPERERKSASIFQSGNFGPYC